MIHDIICQKNLLSTILDSISGSATVHMHRQPRKKKHVKKLSMHRAIGRIPHKTYGSADSNFSENAIIQLK